MVNELLDSLDRLFDLGEINGVTKKQRDEMVRDQTLHPFSEEKFYGQKLPRSYSMDNLEAAKASFSPDREIQPFVSTEMSEPEESLSELTMEQLIQFFESPAKSFFEAATWNEFVG